MVLEGGSFFVDGQGTLLTTESCLLNPNRDPGMKRADIEAELRRMLGVSRIVWLPGNPSEVETDGHIGGVASFIAPGRILFNAADPDQEDYYRAMQDNRRALQLATDAQGRRFEILDIPVPRGAEDFGSKRFCDTYARTTSSSTERPSVRRSACRATRRPARPLPGRFRTGSWNCCPLPRFRWAAEPLTVRRNSSR
jgi:agmatine/peptidylarginine deiminase